MIRCSHTYCILVSHLSLGPVRDVRDSGSLSNVFETVSVPNSDDEDVRRDARFTHPEGLDTRRETWPSPHPTNPIPQDQQLHEVSAAATKLGVEGSAQARQASRLRGGSKTTPTTRTLLEHSNDPGENAEAIGESTHIKSRAVFPARGSWEIRREALVEQRDTILSAHALDGLGIGRQVHAESTPEITLPAQADAAQSLATMASTISIRVSSAQNSRESCKRPAVTAALNASEKLSILYCLGPLRMWEGLL
ncbi:unnamed protein product [Diplocarpon coronariae]